MEPDERATRIEKIAAGISAVVRAVTLMEGNDAPGSWTELSDEDREPIRELAEGAVDIFDNLLQR